MTRADGAVLLTGATGFVGMELLARYLERTERPVFTIVRAGTTRPRASGSTQCSRTCSACARHATPTALPRSRAT